MMDTAFVVVGLALSILIGLVAYRRRQTSLMDQAVKDWLVNLPTDEYSPNRGSPVNRHMRERRESERAADQDQTTKNETELERAVRLRNAISTAVLTSKYRKSVKAEFDEQLHISLTPSKPVSFVEAYEKCGLMRGILRTAQASRKKDITEISTKIDAFESGLKRYIYKWIL